MCGQVDAHRQATGTKLEFSGHDQSQIEVFNRQADGAGIREIGFLDAPESWVINIHGGVLPVGTNADKTISVIDAYGQAADLRDFPVGKGDGFRTFFGEGHGGRQLDKASQVYLRVTDLGLDNFFTEIKDNGVVAAGWDRKAIDCELVVAVAVFTLLQGPVVVQVFRRIRKTGLIVDGGRPHQLQCSVCNGPAGDQEGIDIDFNIVRLHIKQTRVNPHKHCRSHIGFGRYEFWCVGAELQQGGWRHDGKAEIHVVQHQANGGVVDAVEQAIRAACGPARHIDAIAVRATHSGKA